MRELAVLGYSSIACNQRGYSPGASPDDQAEYKYEFMVQDVFNIASAVFPVSPSSSSGSDSASGPTFHLVAHDHGAGVGWLATASAQGQIQILSYSTLSIPHPEMFSKAMMEDPLQQISSQYFKNISSLPAYAHPYQLSNWCYNTADTRAQQREPQQPQHLHQPIPRTVTYTRPYCLLAHLAYT